MRKVHTFALAKTPITVAKNNRTAQSKKIKRGNSSVGRAQPCQGWGREFESRFPLFHIEAKVLPFNRKSFSSEDFNNIQTYWRGGGIGRRATLRG